MKFTSAGALSKNTGEHLPQRSKLVFLVGEAGCINSCKPTASS